MEGLQNGELISISGPTKHGKTLLAQTMTYNMVQRDQEYPLWFTFEVPPKQFLSRFPGGIPMIYMPTKLKNNSLEWLYERCLEAHAKYFTRCIFIDHLHYLVDMARIKNTSLEIGNVIRKLKLFAVQNNFVIVLLCHTTKLNDGEDLSFQNIRDSSLIAQESDCVIMVRRTPKDGEDTAKARVEFHRRTGVLEKYVGLVKVNGLLKERLLSYEGWERPEAKEKLIGRNPFR